MARSRSIAAVASYTPKAKYPNTNFAKGLQVLAEVIVQGLGLRVGYVTLGGFDTHGEQKDTPGATLALQHARRGAGGVLRRSRRATAPPTTWW